MKKSFEVVFLFPFYGLGNWGSWSLINVSKEKIDSIECRVPENSKENKKAFLSEQCKEIEEKQ